MSFAEDCDAGRRYFITVGMQLAKQADHHNDVVSALLDKVIVCAVLAELPGDLPLRARLFPNVFNLQA